MDEELEKIIGEGDKEKSDMSLEEKPKETEAKPEEKKPDEEAEKKEEQLSNLNKAIFEANEKLRTIREVTKKAKITIPTPTEEDEIPPIDENAPEVKAWDKRVTARILSTPNPEVEKAKEERRTFVLRHFLADRPALAKNTEKVKELMSNYERLRTSTELTAEGISFDLERAYAATFYNELLQAAQERRINQARTDEAFSEIAVSKGATAYYKDESSKIPRLTTEQRAKLAEWKMTEAEWAKLYEEQQAKQAKM